jgi:hypothetical protein
MPLGARAGGTPLIALEALKRSMLQDFLDAAYRASPPQTNREHDLLLLQSSFVAWSCSLSPHAHPRMARVAHPFRFIRFEAQNA